MVDVHNVTKNKNSTTQETKPLYPVSPAIWYKLLDMGRKRVTHGILLGVYFEGTYSSVSESFFAFWTKKISEEDKKP